MNTPRTGACVYAGNNSRLRGIAYRLNGSLIGYADAEKTAKIKGHAKLRTYLIDPLAGGAKIPVIGKSDMPSPAYGPDYTAVLPGQQLVKELRYTATGKLKMRCDSSAVFKVAADGLKSLYAGTVVRSFANVHDDEADGGTESDSLNNFMEDMNELAESQQNLDYFAYSGHGSKGSLPSAGLRMGGARFKKFAECLRTMLRSDGTVVFYACSTAIIGGFAQALSKELPGVTVFGHLSAGHGFTNPETGRYLNNKYDSFKDLLGEDYKKWVRCIKSSSDIWRRFPWMTIDEIRAEAQAY